MQGDLDLEIANKNGGGSCLRSGQGGAGILNRGATLSQVQGGEDSKDSSSCRSFSESIKEPLNLGHFCGKSPIKIRDPMSLRHPV